MSNKSNARDYLLHYVKKPLEGVIKKVLNKKPDDPIPLILSALEEIQGINNEPLSHSERIELDALRHEYEMLNRKLRRLQGDEQDLIEEAKSQLHTITHRNDDDTESEEESDEPLSPLPKPK